MIETDAWVVTVERECAEDNFIDSVWVEERPALKRKATIEDADRDDVGRVKVQHFLIGVVSQFLED